MDDQLLIALTFCFYLLITMLVGVLGYRHTRNLSDYLLGGRSLGPWVAALSAGASDMSGWLLMGLPGLAYAQGLASGWIALGLLAGTYANWRLMARRLHAFTSSAGDALTLPSYLEARFKCSSRLLRLTAGFVIVFFFTIYTSSGLVAGGKLFVEVFQLPYETAVTLATLAILSYTLFGGFLAVSWNDVIQGLMMSAALLIVPCYGVMASGGFVESWQRFASTHSSALFGAFNDAQGRELSWISLSSFLAWGLGYFGQPHILARFKAVESRSSIPQATRIASVWTAFCLFGAMATGLAGLSYFGPGLGDPERVFMNLVGLAFHPLLAGMLFAAVLAAIMSTAASQLLVASAVLAEDLYRTFAKGRAEAPHKLIRVGRLAVALITALAFVMALDPGSMVLEVVAYAWAGFGAAFGPVLLLSLFWRGFSEAGALAGIIGGGLSVLVWRHLPSSYSQLYEMIPAMIIASVAAVVASLLWKASPAAVAVYDLASTLDESSR